MNTESKNIAVHYNKVNPLAGRVLFNESGAALVAALLLMVAMITIIPVAMHLTAQDIKRTSTFQGNREAFFMAEAGLQHVGAIYQDNDSNDLLRGDGKARHATASNTINDDNGNFFANGNDQDFVITGSSQVTTNSKIDDTDHIYTQVDFEGGTYQIRIWDNVDSALCPAGCSAGNADPMFNTDFEDWVDRDGMVYAESIGTTGDGETVTIKATLKRKFIPSYGIPGAVVLVGPLASVFSQSANYDVTGAASVGGCGYDIGSGTDCECTGQGGIAIEALGETGPAYIDYDETLTTEPDLDDCENPTSPPTQYNDICISLSTNARKAIQGVNADGGTNPSPNPDIVPKDDTFTGDDAAKLYEDVITNGTPDLTLADPAGPSDMTSWGSYDDPVVVHATGDFNMAGNHTGYGILVVDGDFNMAGIITWNGIVLIGACTTCTGKLSGVGTLTTNGTVIIGNNDPSIRSKTDFAGTARFNYSCEGIAVANGAYRDSFQIVAWNEVTK